MNYSTTDNRLSVLYRICVAFASGALVAVFLLPVWRIDLFAPQYPEGLNMKIWINGLSGDIDVINGLNHYIGMKHITVAMFPEFSYLPYVVGFFMVLGLVVSVTGSRKILFIYLLLTVTGGVLAMYDFYTWGYDYGHHLDPTAPIQVPGLSYQPPLIGHKRLLNFDAYSFPDTGGWVVIVAGALASAAWLADRFLHRGSTFKLRLASPPVTAAILLMFFSACSTTPVPFIAGKDNCDFCKMGISDTRFGGEVITKKGKIYKFDDLHCMISFLRKGGVKENNIGRRMVMNFNKPNEFLEETSAVFVACDELKSPMGSNAAGFKDQENATGYSAGKKAEILTWSQLYIKAP
jgi:copper chaperone NosL